MKKWALLASVLSVLVLGALPTPAHAQAKDTLTVALVAHVHPRTPRVAG